MKIITIILLIGKQVVSEDFKYVTVFGDLLARKCNHGLHDLTL